MIAKGHHMFCKWYFASVEDCLSESLWFPVLLIDAELGDRSHAWAWWMKFTLLALQLVLAMTFVYDFQFHGHFEDLDEAGGGTRPIRSLRSLANCPRSWHIDGGISTW